MKPLIPFFIVIFLFSCAKDDVNPADNTVHLAGHLLNSNMDGDYTASYWKDGTYTALTTEGIKSKTSSLSVNGSSIVIGGTTRTGNTFPVSVYWRNGSETTLDGIIGEPMITLLNDKLYGVWLETSKGWVVSKNGISQPLRDTTFDFAPMDMVVVGEDIYSSGYSSPRSSSPNEAVRQYAQCWKNDQLIFRENELSNGLSIFAYKNDIYMSGHYFPPNSTNGAACYWKNGQRIDLTDGSKGATAASIVVVNDHIYLAGMVNDQAVYWKDGELIMLTTGGTFSMANSIFVKGTDVHVAGYEHGYPAYWKNGVKQEIENQDKLGKIIAVVVGSN